MKLTVGDRDMVELVPLQLEMLEDTDLTLFTVKRWSLGYGAGNTTSELKMVVVLKRKVMNQLLTTYLPSILLIVITFATTFFKPFFFEAALSVNLTTMLVMTTIFIGEMQMLPRTAYIKMIDIWLVFCQLVPFSEVLLLTGMEYFRSESQNTDVDNKANAAKVVWIKVLGEDIKKYVCFHSRLYFFRKEGDALGSCLVRCWLCSNCNFILLC